MRSLRSNAVAPRIDGDLDVARPRIVRGFAEDDGSAADDGGGRDAAIEVERHSIGGGGDEIAADGGHQPADIHGAAGAGVPGPALGRAIAFERIGIEIMLAIAAEAGQRAVVEGGFEDVGIFAVEIEMQHALGPEDQRHRGAGLGIGRLVGQVEIVSEALIVRRRAEAGGDIHLGLHDVVPQRLQRALQRRFAGFEGEVCHGGVEIHGAHGVADHLVLLAHRLVRLAVLVIGVGIALLDQAAALALGLLQIIVVRRAAGRAR